MDKREQAAIAYTGVQVRMKNEPAAYKRMCFRDGWDAAIAALEPAPVSVQEAKEPDFCYNRQDWEVTFDWIDRNVLTEDMLGGEVVEVGTLIRGPTLWVAQYENEDGDLEAHWLESESEARALAEKGEA